MDPVASEERIPASAPQHWAFYLFIVAFVFLFELNLGRPLLPDVVAFALFAVGGYLLAGLEPTARRMLVPAAAGIAVSAVALAWPTLTATIPQAAPAGGIELLRWAVVLLQVALAAATVWYLCRTIAALAERLGDESTLRSAEARAWGYLLFAGVEVLLFAAVIWDPDLLGLALLVYVGLFLFVTVAMVDLVFQGERLLGPA